MNSYSFALVSSVNKLPQKGFYLITDMNKFSRVEWNWVAWSVVFGPVSYEFSFHLPSVAQGS